MLENPFLAQCKFLRMDHFYVCQKGIYRNSKELKIKHKKLISMHVLSSWMWVNFCKLPKLLDEYLLTSKLLHLWYISFLAFLDGVQNRSFFLLWVRPLWFSALQFTIGITQNVSIVCNYCIGYICISPWLPAYCCRSERRFASHPTHPHGPQAGERPFHQFRLGLLLRFEKGMLNRHFLGCRQYTLYCMCCVHG